jgi:GNAT superfamily N-acetyltransferase
MAVHVRELPPGLRRAAAELLADAFVDYPAWLSIGPRSRPRRWTMLRRFYTGAIARAERWGGPVSCATDERETIAVAIAYGPGTWPPPARSFPREAWGVALAGPGAALRGLASSTAIDSAHPAEPHVFVHTLGVDPRHQRRGAGGALLGPLIAEAERLAVPVHLTTSSRDNLPYYRRFGFEVVGESSLPRDVPLWSMIRSA